MSFLLSKKYILTALFLLIVQFTLRHFSYRVARKSYHHKVSDSSIPYLNLTFNNHYDTLEVYTIDQGTGLYLKCLVGQSDTLSGNYKLPVSCNTPYDYIMSGELDEDITQLRLTVDLKEALREQGAVSGLTANHNKLQEEPIVFNDVGDQIRYLLGVY